MTNIFFFTDIHGHLPLFNYIISWCLEQDPNCIIIYGGDACDRGEHGYEIIKQLLNNKQIIYLYGNHEELFVNAANKILKTNSEIHYCNKEQAKTIINQMRILGDEEVILHLQNGGQQTLLDWISDGAPENIISLLSNLPRTYSYQNFDFCHAGATYQSFLNWMNSTYDRQAIIWDRSCISLGWETGRIGVFGHTPTVFLPKGIYGRNQSLTNIHPCYWQDRMGGKKKRGGWKLDMDTGAYATNRAFVFNCNDTTITGFDMDSNKIVKVLEQYQINFT